MSQNDFELLRTQELPEINTLARLFRHRKTGAEILSLENDDENKVFAITFRTPPPNSTGLPHIMEHAVLCGSKKYPVKEPFVELMKGSLNTFVNAFTFEDKTMYPVASQNDQDLYNLIDVYLDAVFFPRITPQMLQQEGWHFELEDIKDPLTFKGVVFNEMKGAYSSPDSLLYRYSGRALFPDTPYHFDSGGDPAVIPDLSYREFKSFHQTYYHPSNARVFFYGDDDPAKRLELLREYLDAFDPLQIDSQIPLQPPLDRPQRVAIPYDAGDDQVDGNQAMITMNWLLGPSTDPETALGFSILEHILIGTPASPLRKALIDSGLGEDLAGAGLNDQMRQAYFSTGLKGIKLPDAGRVEALILDTLASLAHDGIQEETKAASLNTVEFTLRENNTSSFPRGLALLIRSMATWLYDGDPLAPLAFEEPLTAIKQRLAAKQPYFERLIERFFLQNDHRATVTLEPTPGLNLQKEKAEADRLAAHRAAMTQEELEAVICDTRELRRLQETPDSPEALAAIPTLSLGDLDRKNKLIPLALLQEHGSRILYHDLFTNGILYLDLGFDLHTLPQDLLPYIPLFGEALVSIGTEAQDFVQLSQRIGAQTGGITTDILTSAVRGSQQGEAWLVLRGKATAERAGDLLRILEDILKTIKLDNRERFRQLALESKAQQEANLLPSGHRVVHTRLGSLFNEANWAAEQMEGLEGLFFTRRLIQELENGWPAVLEKLETLRRILINRNAMLFNVTLDENNWQPFQPQLAEFIAALPAWPIERVPWSPQAAPPYQGFTIPAQVNYVAKGANLYQLGYELDGSILVIRNYLRTTWLWERIRVQGGAYGGFCLFDPRSGLFDFLSYRDPNLLNTLDNYDKTGEFLRRLDLSQDELVKSIIGTIGQIDDYQLPDAKGYTSMVRYLIRETDQERQQRREQVLATRPEHFEALADLLDRVGETGNVVVLGSKEAIEEANRARNGWLDVSRAL